MLCAYMRPRYQVIVYRTIGPLVMYSYSNEQLCKKTNNMAFALNKDSDQPKYLPSLISLGCLHVESLSP